MSSVAKGKNKGKSAKAKGKGAKGGKPAKKDPKSPKKDPKSAKKGKAKGKKDPKKSGKATQEPKPKKVEKKPVVVDYGPPVILPEAKEYYTEVPPMVSTPLEDDDNVAALEAQFDELQKLLKNRKKACIAYAKVLVSKQDEGTAPICMDIEGMKHIINSIGTKRGEKDFAVLESRQGILDRGRELLAYEAKHAVVTKQREKTTKTAVQAEIDDCKAKLSEAEPVLQAAKDALHSITKSSLDEIRALPKPHALLVKAVKACAVMVGRDESELNGWPNIKKLLKTAFIDSLLGFEARNITPAIREILEGPNFLAKDDDSVPDAERLTVENVTKANKVAGSLVRWIEAQLKYNEFIPLVEPIQAQMVDLKVQLGNVEGVQAKLDTALAELATRADNARAQIREQGRDFGNKLADAKACEN